LVCQIGQNGQADVILSEPLSVLPEAELLKPIRNLLHSRPPWLSFAKRQSANVSLTDAVRIAHNDYGAGSHCCGKSAFARGFTRLFLKLIFLKGRRGIGRSGGSFVALIVHRCWTVDHRSQS
jgi:hypothetical protein